MTPIYQYEFTVPENTVDENGHVNNVVYIQWMQDVAVLHAEETGCTRATRSAGATWVVRSHTVEYLRPAYIGDTIAVLTWVVNFRRVRSLRRYKFVRPKDNVVIARGETDWVFVDGKTGRPLTIPDEVKNTFELVAEDQEPCI
ncbi:MAG: acyl-CoA thioesterase [Thermodesulfovibrionales bacterium]|nr:acyl-CoA thioesterase [Thermodesulfovibrionales bacterium]